MNASNWGSILALARPFVALDACNEPIEALEQSLALEGAGLLYGPLPIPDLGQGEGVADLLGVERPLLILLVGKDEEDGLPQLFLFEHCRQLSSGDGHTFRVGRIDHKYDGVRVRVVTPPVRSN